MSKDLIDFSDPFLIAAIIFAFYNPIAWNLIGRFEFHTKSITKICGGNKYVACYIFAAYIFTIGIARDIVYKIALSRQPKSAAMSNIPFIDLIGNSSFIVGSVLVVSSMYKLGITGTYLGDHFGILMKDRITTFPFNIVDHPMYYGSSLCFLSIALKYIRDYVDSLICFRTRSPAGILVTCLIMLAYSMAAEYESKFTAQIYSKQPPKKSI